MLPDRRQVMFTALAGALASAGRGWASGADEPLLTLRNLRLNGSYGEIRFGMVQLMSMPWQEIVTGNVYLDAPARFRGPSAHTVVSMIGHADATNVRLIAANDFFAEIRIAELARFEAVLAMEMNGKPLTRRDHGPIWLMYPIDHYPELRDSVYNNRLVSQLRVIELF